MLTVKWQNNSGDWFDSVYPDLMGHVIFAWKQTGGVAVKVELWQDGILLDNWER